MFRVLAVAFALVGLANAFLAPSSPIVPCSHIVPATGLQSRSALSMNIFDNLAAYMDKMKDKRLVTASHILARGQGRDELLEDLKAKIDNDPEKFAEYATKFSQCPSGKMGGMLGQFERLKMVGPFDDAAFSAPVGEVIGPVGTPFGAHLILVHDRTGEEPADTKTV
eukprot:CAMPEP_0113936138 /NCGR_PEP_ID=MMETSP1339-20121228/3112_1 /TAXON_ID=94617 /ORGANISM="Fibrocapsa japonica" /LENGTH=166 /DNA_ID=CAMNT_0000938497 /DNA_START=57 /DNA_END=557 /DNA_ORIENTATION=- /assembly_acc=CAM_ASM_000762